MRISRFILFTFTAFWRDKWYAIVYVDSNWLVVERCLVHAIDLDYDEAGKFQKNSFYMFSQLTSWKEAENARLAKEMEELQKEMDKKRKRMESLKAQQPKQIKTEKW